MNVKRLLIAAAFALLAAGAAQANQTWAWTYSGVGIVASGTFVTAGLAVAPEDILSVTGTRNGDTIVGLVPLDEDGDFSYDNQFTSANPHFTDSGVLFDFGAGLPHVNLYFFNGSYQDIDGFNLEEVPVSFSVTAVPEPATVLSMLAGLGLLAAYTRKLQRQQEG